MELTVKTTRFGELQLDEKNKLTFVEGILGFAGLKDYVLYQPSPDSAFIWMQSMERPELAFVVCDPRIVDPDYKVPARPEEVSVLEISDPEKTRVLVIVSHPQDASKMTVNLMGPLVVNTDNGFSKQLVLTDKRYTTKHKVFSEK